MSIEFLLTSLIVCVLPGIGVIYTLSITLGSGLRAGLWATVGCTLVTALHLAFAMLGLAAILHASAVLFQAVKWIGVAFLLWMAWGTLTSGGIQEILPERRLGAFRIARRGFLLNLFNPKLPIFFAAFLPQFVPLGDPQGTLILFQLGLVFVLMTAGVFTLYALFAAHLRNAILNSPRAIAWLRRVFAASFGALAGRLALERA